MNKRKFPFVPTKSSEIENGDFYSIPLSNGKFACGRLLLIEKSGGRKTKIVLVGLHNWLGENHPTEKDIHQCSIIEQGEMHINSIAHVNGQVLGNKPLCEDGLKPILQFSAGYLLDGFDFLRELPKEEYDLYSRRSTYGLDCWRKSILFNNLLKKWRML